MEQILLWNFQKEPNLPTPGFQTSKLPEQLENTFLLFKLPSLWYFVVATTGNEHAASPLSLHPTQLPH